jgi:hypothetical protein
MRQAEQVYTPVLNEAQRRRFDALQAEIERTLHEMAATLQRKFSAHCRPGGKAKYGIPDPPPVHWPALEPSNVTRLPRH